MSKVIIIGILVLGISQLLSIIKDNNKVLNFICYSLIPAYIFYASSFLHLPIMLSISFAILAGIMKIGLTKILLAKVR